MIKRIRAIFFRRILNIFCGTRFFGLKRFLLLCAGVSCGKNVCVVGPLYFGNVSKITIGDNVWIGRNFKIYGNGNVTINNNVDIAPEVCILTGSHEISNDIEHRAGIGKTYDVIIESGCWIGTRATILGNITLKKGCVVGACSFVNKSCESNLLYAGIPAKPLKSI